MKVHELAERVEVAPHVVRYYSQRELLRPVRNPSNKYREYSESDVNRLRFICRARHLGFTIDAIKLILNDVDAGGSPRAQVRELIRRRANENERRLTEAQQLQRRMRRAIATWEAMPDDPSNHLDPYQLIDALFLDNVAGGRNLEPEA